MSSNAPIHFLNRGQETYLTTLIAMQQFTANRADNTPDQIWFVEHPPVYTLGQAADPLHLLVQNTAIPLVQTDRGGQITYHGTGQLVAYLLIDIKRRNWFVKDFVYHIETIMINTLAKFDVPAVRHENAPGVYLKIDQGQLFHELNGAKIGAIGLKIKQGCSYHGLSLNVAMDLQPFSWINPCGYAGLITTDMASINQAPPPLATHTTLENPPLSPILGEVLVQLQHQLSLVLGEKSATKNNLAY